MKRSDEFFVVI